MIPRLALIFLSMCTIGCSVGSDFTSPEPDLGDSYSAEGSGGAERKSVPASSAPADLEWWKAFNDPLLTSLLERASDSNLDLNIAAARIREARANLLAATGSLLPSLGSSASFRRNRNAGSVIGSAVSGGGGNTGTLPTVATGGSSGANNLFQAGFDASWELDIFGGLRREREAAEADLESRRNDARDVFRTMAAEIAQTYFTLRGIQERRGVAERTLAAQKHSADLVRERFHVGFVSRLDITNADAQVATTRSAIPPLMAQEQKLIYTLSVLLGRRPAELVSELERATPLPEMPRAVPIGLPSELARRRPDIRSAESQLHAATARTGAAIADLFPKFSLTGAFGYRGSDASDLGTWSNRYWTLGSGLSWPVFDGGRIAANIEATSAREEQAVYLYRKTVLTALQDVEAALTDFGYEQGRFSSLNEAVSLNEVALRLANQQYRDGTSDYLNVLTAERNLYGSQDALVQSKQAITTALVALYKSLGGGWESIAP